MLRKTIRVALVLLIVVGFLGILFTYGAYQNSQREYAKLQANKFVLDVVKEPTTEVIKKQIDHAYFKAINPDYIGWLEIEYLQINYPMVQSKDNSYYLKKTFEKNTNKSGAIFLDYRNSALFDEYHTILFGHSMKDKTMFGNLKKLKGVDLSKEEVFIYVDIEEHFFTYKIIYYGELAGNDPLYSMLQSLDSSTDKLAKRLQALDIDFDSSYLTLSTCADNISKRNIVIAKQVSVVPQMQ